MKVKDVMVKDPVKVSSNITLYELQKIFDSVPFWTLFVVENEKLVGVVTRNDLLKRGSKLPLDAKVHEIMSKPYYKIKPNADIGQAEQALNKHNMTSLPVVDKNDNLIGVIGINEIKQIKNYKECSYHNCKNGATQKCVYCNDYFCDEHIESYEPEFGRDFNKKHKDVIKGHPCLESVKEKNYKRLAEDIVNNARMQYFIGGSKDVNWWIDWYLKKYDRYEKERIQFYLPYYKEKMFEEIREEKKRKKDHDFILNNGFNREWIGQPVSNVTGKKFQYWPHLFLLFIFAIISIAFLNSINVINLDVYGTSCGDVQSGQCLGIKPLYCNDGKLEKNTMRCGCGPNQTIFNNDCYLACYDGTIYGNCSEKNVSYICLNGTLKYSPDVCGCPKNMEFNGTDCIFKTCLDGTIYDNCSLNKPLYCKEGVLVNDSKKCGCPENFVSENNICVKSCSDGTKYGQCSKNKPYYCYEGELISLAKTCGCPSGSRYKQDGEKCIDFSNPDPKEIEQKVHNLINIERIKHGLSELEFNEKIAVASRLHSQDMVNLNYFSHSSPFGETFVDRYRKVGFSCNIYLGNMIYGGAENIFQGWTYSTIYYTNGVETSRMWNTPDKIANEAVVSWMNSPGHRENILTPYWKTQGIGVAVSKDGKVLITQNFC